MLLKSGMSVRQAVLYNALSAMMAYLGLMTGILIGHYAENISMWIFALTAGLFMYVALVDMVSSPPPSHGALTTSSSSVVGIFMFAKLGLILEVKGQAGTRVFSQFGVKSEVFFRSAR